MQSRMDPSPPTVIDQERIDAGVVAVRVSGELDLATAGDLEGAVDSSLSEYPGLLVIDLTDCSFIDSTVLSVLVSVRRRINGSVPTAFAIVAGDQPLDVLRLTRLDEEIPVFATVAEAVGALRAGGTAAVRS